MKKRKAAEPLSDAKGEVRELFASELASFRPAREVLPPEFFADLRAERTKRRTHQFGAGRMPPTRSPA